MPVGGVRAGYLSMVSRYGWYGLMAKAGCTVWMGFRVTVRVRVRC